MSFEHHHDEEPDPHVVAVLVPGLAFLGVSIVQMCFAAIFMVMLALDPQMQQDWFVVVAATLFRGLPTAVHLLVGTLLVFMASRGRSGRFPDTIGAIVLLAGLWGVLSMVWEFCTCNCLMVGFGMMPTFTAIPCGVFLLNRERPED